LRANSASVDLFLAMLWCRLRVNITYGV
jgi:hypothetical protein